MSTHTWTVALERFACSIKDITPTCYFAMSPNDPAGLRQMPEAERLATLQLLDSNKAEVEARLAALPIIIETPSAVSHTSVRALALAPVRQIDVTYVTFAADNLTGVREDACGWDAHGVHPPAPAFARWQ
jgi:hypothetical protein